MGVMKRAVDWEKGSRRRQPSTSTVDHCPFLLVDVCHPALFHWSMSTTALFYWSTLTTALFYWSTALFMTNCIIKQPSCSFLPGRRRPLPFSTSRRQPSCSFLPSRQSTVDSQQSTVNACQSCRRPFYSLFITPFQMINTSAADIILVEHWVLLNWTSSFFFSWLNALNIRTDESNLPLKMIKIVN